MLFPDALGHEMEIPEEEPRMTEEEKFDSAMAELNDIEPESPEC